MSEYIKKSSIVGLAHKMQFGRILTDREVEVVEMVVNSVHDDAQVDLVRCEDCLFSCLYNERWTLPIEPEKYWCKYRDEETSRYGYCSQGERKGGDE